MLTNKNKLNDQKKGPTLSKLQFFEKKIIWIATMKMTLNLGTWCLFTGIKRLVYRMSGWIKGHLERERERERERETIIVVFVVLSNRDIKMGWLCCREPQVCFIEANQNDCMVKVDSCQNWKNAWRFPNS